MPAVNPQGVIAAIAASLKQPVVSIVFGLITVIAGYAVTTTTVKNNSAAIEELKAKQRQFERDALTKEQFDREMSFIKQSLEDVKNNQKEQNKRLDEVILRKAH